MKINLTKKIPSREGTDLSKNAKRFFDKSGVGLVWFIALSLFSPLPTSAQTSPSGKAILQKIDDNMSSSSRIYTSQMIVHGRRADRIMESKSWSIGEDKAFTEYTAPAREKGTKMLKLDDKLWMYSPDTDRTIQISGHMLRQSVMGSDLSYEDMMEDKKLQDSYAAVIVAEDSMDGRPTWVLELTATEKDLAYHMRKLWVDKVRNIPLRQELYAKSGTLLKELELKDVVKIDNRWFPQRMIFKDVLKKGKGTEFVFLDIQFDQPIPDYIFSKAALRK
ncbi:outer membrane lipoprotein-sorting protein [candidate division KSB1 bacterium]|nr:outer membrane lipoprotein-sorting protein [candidate division KSB1 bacterium]